MGSTPSKAIQLYREAVAAVDDAIALRNRQAGENEPFVGRVARELLPMLDAMKRFLAERSPEETGLEILRVSQSMRRFQEGTYTSLSSFPKYIRQSYYLKGVAAMVIVGGMSLGRGLPEAGTSA